MGAVLFPTRWRRPARCCAGCKAFTYHFQRRTFTAPWLEIEAECFGQSDLRDTIIILRGDQLWDLIVERHLGLQDVEARNSSRFKTILLILQLLFQQIHGLLLHVDELSIDHYLVELRF